jgi:hypothetical protein
VADIATVGFAAPRSPLQRWLSQVGFLTLSPGLQFFQYLYQLVRYILLGLWLHSVSSMVFQNALGILRHCIFDSHHIALAWSWMSWLIHFKKFHGNNGTNQFGGGGVGIFEPWRGGSDQAAAYLRQMDEDSSLHVSLLQSCTPEDKVQAKITCSKYLDSLGHLDPAGFFLNDCVYDVCHGAGEVAAELAAELLTSASV